MLAVVYWTSSSRGTAKVEHGFAKCLEIDLLGYFDENILFPLRNVDEVCDGERHVGFVVGGVLGEDDVSPGLIEISGCHSGHGRGKMSLVSEEIFILLFKS